MGNQTMQLSDAASARARAIEEGPREYFIYYEWMERGDIPMDVTHVRINSSVTQLMMMHSIIACI